MNRYFEFTGKTRVFDGVELHQIRATTTFECGVAHPVFEGSIGGWIEKSENLTDRGWVLPEGMVYGNALISGRAIVYSGIVRGNAVLTDRASVWNDAVVEGNAQICDCAHVHGDAVVKGNAVLKGYAYIKDYACVHGNAVINGGTVRDCGVVCGSAVIGRNVDVGDYVRVYGNFTLTKAKLRGTHCLDSIEAVERL